MPSRKSSGSGDSRKDFLNLTVSRIDRTKDSTKSHSGHGYIGNSVYMFAVVTVNLLEIVSSITLGLTMYSRMTLNI